MTTTALDRAHSKAQRLERELREARAALADAWDEGYVARLGDTPRYKTRAEGGNPYRAALDQDGDETCPHLSYTGVDTYFGPGKIWRCDSCDYEKAADW